MSPAPGPSVLSALDPIAQCSHKHASSGCSLAGITSAAAAIQVRQQVHLFSHSSHALFNVLPTEEHATHNSLARWQGTLLHPAALHTRPHTMLAVYKALPVCRDQVVLGRHDCAQNVIACRSRSTSPLLLHRPMKPWHAQISHLCFWRRLERAAQRKTSAALAAQEQPLRAA